MRLGLILPALLLIAGPASAQDPAPGRGDPDIVLTGDVTRDGHQTYIELPFDVPEGTARITVEFDYDAGDARATLDLGLLDPNGFRGWSGGNKSGFVVAETFATPSYLPGPVEPGEWAVLLGAPFIAEDATVVYEARIWLDEAPGALTQPVRGGGGWLRGDFHAHTGHSDGYCPNASGERAPCPVHKTVEAAREAGLDFIAITDHNTVSHFAEMNALQAYYDDITLISGVEVTTFFGHANIFGATDFTEFRLTSAGDAEALFASAAARGAVASINHPALPSGEACMGCGWTGPTEGAVAVEAVNGANARRFGVENSPVSGVRYWEARLNEGARATAIGGSDNHDAADVAGQNQSPIGAPTTVVWAENASVAAILDGVRTGRVFIDLADDRNWWIDLTATSGDSRTIMGSVLSVEAGDAVVIEAAGAGPEGAAVEFIGPVSVLATAPLEDARLELAIDETTTWVRANLRTRDGAIALISNPIYFEIAAP